jgi:phenylpropionate dioxygenase-like ring-hydroxylating dioxygenase large terminal subunit
MRVYKQYIIDDSLRKKTEAYYQTIELGAVGNLDNYINPEVDKWYNKNNLTLDEIKIDTYQYLKKYPHTKTNIKWDTFEVTPLNDDYLATYQLDYQIFSKRLKNKVYHLTIKALWGENMKLKSIYEINE